MNTDARIKHLGSSYYTKWLYFASAAPDIEGASAAPILDDQIIKWLGHEAGIWFRSGSTKAYSAYLELLRSWGDQYDRTPVQVETERCSGWPPAAAEPRASYVCPRKLHHEELDSVR